MPHSRERRLARNRVAHALRALGGEATVQEVTRVLRKRPGNVSAQLAGMARRGYVERAGKRLVRAQRWHNGRCLVPATLWRLKCD